MPSEALQEFERAPVGLLETILTYRAYASAKEAYETVQQWEDSPAKRKAMNRPLVRRVHEIDFALAREAIEQRSHNGR